MRKHILWASATLALAFGGVMACGGASQTASTSPAPTPCVNQSLPHHAYVVVEHASRASLQKCVGFSGDSITAQQLMDESGIEYQTQDFGSMGKAVCQVDKEPAQYTKCFADSGPNWTLFVETGGQWAEAQTGYSQVTLHDKDALGWIYTAAASPAPPPLPKE